MCIVSRRVADGLFRDVFDKVRGEIRLGEKETSKIALLVLAAEGDCKAQSD